MKSKTEDTKKSQTETKKSEKKETKKSENEKARKMKLADEIHDSQRKEQQNASRRKKQESTEFREKEQQQNAKQQSEKRKDPLVLIRDRANARASVYPCNLVILMNKHIPQLFFFSENKFLYSENIFWLGEGGLGAELPLYAKGWCFHCPQNIDWRVHFPLLITSNVDLF